jgi:hypothetical protein
MRASGYRNVEVLRIEFFWRDENRVLEFKTLDEQRSSHRLL